MLCRLPSAPPRRQRPVVRPPVRLLSPRRRAARGWLLAPVLVGLLLVGCQSTRTGSGTEADPAAVSEPWAWELPDCVGYRATDYQAPGHRLDVRVRSAAGTITQVEDYQSGWGERAVTEIRRVLRECASYEHGGRGGPVGYRRQHLIVDTGFAGDESLLVEVVEQRPPELETWYAAVVRHGDRITTFRSEQLDADELRRLIAQSEATGTAPPT